MKIKAFWVLIFCSLFIWVAVMYSCFRKTKKIFTEAKLGQNEKVITDTLGKPDHISNCGKYLWWGGDESYIGLNDGICVKWSRYDCFLTKWAFGYSKDGSLVSKYHYVLD